MSSKGSRLSWLRNYMETVHTRTVQFTKIRHDTIEVRYFGSREINLRDAISDYNVFDKFTGLQPCRQLIILGHFSNLTLRAGSYIMSETEKRKRLILAEAIVVDSARQNIGAFIYFLRFRKYFPVKIFSNEKEALNWLISVDVNKKVSGNSREKPVALQD